MSLFSVFRPMVLTISLVFCLHGVSAAFGPAQPPAQSVVIPVVLVFPDYRTGSVLPALTVSVSRRMDEDPLRFQWIARSSGVDAGALAAMLTTALPFLGLDSKGLIVVAACSDRFIPSGNSFSAAIVVATAAVLQGHRLLRNVVLTGTVNPDGTIGPVGDLPIKAAAATAAGYRLLYPAIQSELGETEHIPVATIRDAYARSIQ